MFRCERGATIVDSLVAMLIFAVVLTASTSLFAFATRAFSRETVRVGVHQDVAGAKNVVLDDLSVASFRPDDLVAAGPFATPVPDSFRAADLSTSLDSISFWADVDSVSGTDHVCYGVTAGELRRSVQAKDDSCGAGAVETLASGVQGFELTFLDANRAGPLSVTDVVTTGLARYVQVTLTVAGTAKGGPVSQIERGETSIRN